MHETQFFCKWFFPWLSVARARQAEVISCPWVHRRQAPTPPGTAAALNLFNVSVYVT